MSIIGLKTICLFLMQSKRWLEELFACQYLAGNLNVNLNCWLGNRQILCPFSSWVLKILSITGWEFYTKISILLAVKSGYFFPGKLIINCN